MGNGQATSKGALVLEQNINSRITNAPSSLALPAPTAWPLVLAFGLTLLAAGLLTSAYVSALGAVLTVAGWVGWFCDVLPS